jgi:Na+/H+ antiporter NhaD/arsenite permease-like protein
VAERSASQSEKLITPAVLMLTLTALVAVISWQLGLVGKQVLSVTVFVLTVLGTLFFWSFRLAIAFLGIAVLLLCHVLTIPKFVESSSFEVILFLAGMMIVVATARDLGFFTWIIQLIISMPGLTGRRFVAITAATSALLACAVDEVTSILFMAVLIFQVCDTLKLDPTPYLIISVMATNIGSSGTMLGNPVGIFIGTKAGLTFEDFMIWAFPIMLVSLLVTIVVVIVYYRREIAMFQEKLCERRQRELGFGPRVKVAYGRGIAVLAGTVGLVAIHHRLELLLLLPVNTVLLMAPLISAGLIMIWRRDRARHYVQDEVDWWTLLFFLLLFSVVGTLEHTQVTNKIAEGCVAHFGRSVTILIPAIVGITAVGSAFVDNVVFVAAFVPVVKSLAASGLNATPLWWALLFGACYGGNITMIGSTANIVAIGMLERRYRSHIRFLDWLKVGLLVGVITCIVSASCILLLSRWMPRTGVGQTASAPSFRRPEFALPLSVENSVFDSQHKAPAPSL